MFILSEAYYHNSDALQDIYQLIGYHDTQSGPAPPDALSPVAQYCPAFHTWEYWESVWDDRERWEDSPAVQTWMDVESILSARGIHRKWPSICRQGNVSKHTVCRLIMGGLACWSSVWCNWLKTNELPEVWLLQTQIPELSDAQWRHTSCTFVRLFSDKPSIKSKIIFLCRFLSGQTSSAYQWGQFNKSFPSE